MNLSIPKEIVAGEKRVAVVPESVKKFIASGFQVRVEKDAGAAAGFSDEDYKAAGAEIISTAGDLYSQADVLVKVQKPIQHPASGKNELEMLKAGALYVGFFYSLSNADLVKLAATNKVNVLSMDAVPRITRAQRMDALSSQTNLAGYKAVLMAANSLTKIFPLMMTAAGTVQPAKVVIIGAGVAGLQAIATAKRLGAVVEVSDVRPAVKEQVESLGAKYIEPPVQDNLEGQGGYAKEASAEFLRKQQEILGNHIAAADVVITTALVPGKKAPVLVTEEMLVRMRSGSVVVDLAAEQGGNCVWTDPGKTITKNGVTVIGETNVVSHVAFHASQLYSRNVLALMEVVSKEGKIALNLEDEIVKGSLITHEGQIIHEATRAAIGA
ncbi:MAG TPA: Re/Si-specific NAD(P)(+) transhydrogenase subunit alpha [Leptospiraceae bacterium]|nr:Re/Si-specific NAD(P)(+) transhydrogenase subunit alpha [Leptospirales bacterium]HMU82453.1 Re/Si-specific NAD(P)(+) transhydrogenase subunit alpha [Leptospiraceae bacterium]HMX55908.1 Re/Si-specific NAD(P)(+) transhydrogenase subunit alpha [Leptospiraceae bacterium]HMY44282.1 Re/Si-specific NAD(P)(+) transhydrogenase subunit alpha [Leptospiraceae bacterium]HNE24574.1 Re/Si-specific NAD(P)(+) transhydrogenase subunit alpha [Leptospiraceae bacterium]